MSRQANLALEPPTGHHSVAMRTLALAVRKQILQELLDRTPLTKPATRSGGRESATQLYGELVSSIVGGLPKIELEVLRLFYLGGKTPEEIGQSLRLSEKRVRGIKDSFRRKVLGAIQAKKTNRASGLQQNSVMAHAVAVFGDERKASHWLGTPLRLLGGRSPVQAIAEDGDVSVVDRILTRIEHNIPS